MYELDKRKYYAGIGSRETPPDILKKMKTIASILEKRGWVLRSGGADGADSAFEEGVKEKKNKQIFLPWPKFNGKSSRHNRTCIWGEDIAEEFHPNWYKLRDPIKKLMARNTYQVLGPQPGNNPSSFVICWTKDGGPSGGTGQALRIAKAGKIPIFNLYWPEHEEKLMKRLTKVCKELIDENLSA